MNIEQMAREAGLCCDKGHWFSPAGDPDDEIDVSTADLARFAGLVRAQAEAKESERLSIIADELIAGFGEPGRALAEMIRQGVTALESHAAHLLRDVRAQNLEEAAKTAEERPLQSGMDEWDSTAAAIRALASTPEVAK